MGDERAGSIDPGHRTLQRERVLICEDEGVTLLQLQHILNFAGAEIVGSAMTGTEAVEIALRERPTLILMDIRLPDIDGIEAMGRILLAYRPCIVMISAYNGEREQRAMAQGATAYITKPVNSDSLLYDLEAAIQRA